MKKKKNIWFPLWGILLFTHFGQVHGQTLSKYIVVDQFGYRPQSEKVAVIRDPQTGYDAAESFSPGTDYALVLSSNQEHVFTASPIAWKSGTTDISSGDRAWWFDFSSYTEPGTYYVLDIQKNLRSYEFEIGEDVYQEVLKQAMRTFFYQRAGFEKKAAFAGEAWADGASHMGDLQDKNARQYNKTGDASSERDLSGGWYDAGDYNKYTTWTANYVVDFLRAYLENPGAWGDDYNIPESGNKIPDILDETKWGIDHLLKMQNADGSVLAIVGLSHASPPSSATGPSLYGTASTAATLNSAGAFALASKVYAARGMQTYSNRLKEAAIDAWNWAEANPNVIFRNNDSAAGTSGLGAGQQETDDYGRFMAKLEAACFLFEITGDPKYRTFFDAEYTKVHLFEWTYASPFETANQEILLYYTTISNATVSVANAIKAKYLTSMDGEEILPSVSNQLDPYRAYIKPGDYTWGSNSTKALKGLIYSDIVHYDLDASLNETAIKAAEGYIHYLHGLNPFNLVYLSNMYGYGAENSVNEFYHSWFTNGSEKWDRVGISTYGPAPGFVTGGPNPSYDWDGCCPSGCGDQSSICNSENISPPKGQPVQKSYKDFNTSWPLNSWSVTENSNGYQLNYIRLLSKFVVANYDCSGTENGTATYDVCNQCSGGTTGIAPVTDPTNCPVESVLGAKQMPSFLVEVSPNRTSGLFKIETAYSGKYQVKIIDLLGVEIASGFYSGTSEIDLTDKAPGTYLVLVLLQGQVEARKVIKL